MNTGKIVLILLLSIITAPIGGFVWVPVLFLWGKYVKFCIKIDLIVIYFLIRFPIWFFIQLPLHGLKVGSGKIEAFFVAGYNKLVRGGKVTVLLFLIVGAFTAFMIAPGLFAAVNILSPGWWLSSLWKLAKVVVFTVATTILLLSIKDTFSGGIAQKEMPMKLQRGRDELIAAPRDFTQSTMEGVKNTKEAVDTAKEAPEKMKGAFSDISTAGEASESGSLLSSDMSTMIMDLAEEFGMVEGEAAAGEAAAGGAVAGISASTAGLGLAAILLVIFIALVMFIIQLVVVLGFFGMWLQYIAPMILGPLGAALGLGSEYGNWLGGEFADKFLAGMNINFEDEIATVMEARQRLFCLLEGPACLRQWQLNNTRTPDSENVGETYKLQLERFEVGSGEQVDVAYKDGGYRLPVSFGLSNSRNGLYGINALNVSYRLRMVDASRTNLLSGGMDPYCGTKWRPINGYNIREPGNPDTVEVEIGGEEETLEYSGNDLYPGTSAATGFMRLDNITLENCGLLQPGAGETKTVLLEVKYDYFSEATLYFEAMARRVMQENPDIQNKWKASETADTPVKSVLNANSPVLYDQEDIEAIPFDMRASLKSGETDADYRIQHMEIIKSEEVEVADNARDCQFVEKNGVLIPTEETNRTLGITGDEGVDWFSSSNPPPFIGCSLELSDPGQINPSGQTLSMDIMTNYTVKLNQQLERFRILNSRCNAINCPLLVTQQFLNSDEVAKEDNWKIRCTGPDSSDGCSVVKGDPDKWSNIQFMTGDGLLDSKLESGEYAYDPFKAGVVYDKNGHVSDLKENMSGYNDSVGAAIGLTQREVNLIQNRGVAARGFAVLSVPQGQGGIRQAINPERDVQVVRLDTRVCSNIGPDAPLENYKWRTQQDNPFSGYSYSGHSAYLISFFPQDTTCDESGRQSSSDTSGSDSTDSSDSTSSDDGYDPSEDGPDRVQ